MFRVDQAVHTLCLYRSAATSITSLLCMVISCGDRVVVWKANDKTFCVVIGQKQEWRSVMKIMCVTFNPLKGRGNYIATSNNMKSVHWPLVGGLLHLVQRGEDWVGPQPAHAPPRCTKCRPNSPPINGSVPITVLQCNGSLLCGFGVPVKGLNWLNSQCWITPKLILFSNYRAVNRISGFCHVLV